MVELPYIFTTRGNGMKLLAIVFVVAFLNACHAAPEIPSALKAATGFMPPNQLHLEDVLDETYQISENDFDQSIAQAEAFLAPIVAKHGARLLMVKSWQDSTVNAYATRSPDPSHPGHELWEIHSFGGLARRPEISGKDPFLLVILHEASHHISGWPYYPQQSWPASVEGQSDYGAQALVRHLWKGDPENAKAAKVIPPYPKAKCDAAWAQQADRDLCYRAMLAGKSLADLLSYGKARYDQPDKSQVARTNPNHPQGQCRLDTYMAGALCQKAFDLGVIPRDEKESAKYACLKSKAEVGYRPECWFKASL